MKTSIIVQNLKCGGCANTITTKLGALKNITNLEVDVDASKVSFEYDNVNDALEVKSKLKTLGYPSIDSDNSVAAKAMSFVSCATGKMSK